MVPDGHATCHLLPTVTRRSISWIVRRNIQWSWFMKDPEPQLLPVGKLTAKANPCSSSPGFPLRPSLLYQSQQSSLQSASCNLAFPSCCTQGCESLPHTLGQEAPAASEYPGLPPFIPTLFDQVLVLGVVPPWGLFTLIFLEGDIFSPGLINWKGVFISIDFNLYSNLLKLISSWWELLLRNESWYHNLWTIPGPLCYHIQKSAGHH